MADQRATTGPGQLQWRLEVGSSPEIRVLRAPQDDMTMTIAENQTGEDMPDTLTELLRTARRSATVRTFTFHALPGKSSSGSWASK